jgi:predicted nucleic acid-binding protein
MATRVVICDTDVLIDYFDANQLRHNDTKIIIEETISLNQIAISAITKMELLFGATNKTELNQIDKLTKRFGLLLINDEITGKALELMKTYRLSHGLAIPDAIIAATAIITELDFFTYNQRDFRFISGLKLFSI